MAKILIAGLNPAWQQLFTVPGLRIDHVNRAQAFVELASGKGLNVAKILAARGHDVSLWQVLAGSTGQRILEDCQRRGIRSLHVVVEGETRVCTTLLDGPQTTEVIAPFVLDEDPSDRMLALLPNESFDAILVCGTVPAGMNQGVGAALTSRVHTPLVIWDSVAGLSPDSLARVDWLKVNAEEYRTLAPLVAASARAPALLITDGARPATVQTKDAAHEAGMACTLPPLEDLVNPIGAGDTVTAMLAHGLLSGLDPRDAAAKALAAAAASCLNVLPAVWDEHDAARIEANLTWSNRKRV
jgi:tagatose 6-phosphate kinase